MALKNRLKQKLRRKSEENNDAAGNSRLLKKLQNWSKMVHENMDKESLRQMMTQLSGKPCKRAKISGEKLFEAMKKYTTS